MADGKPGELVTWTPEPETGTIPRHVADGLDAVVTLGGKPMSAFACFLNPPLPLPTPAHPLPPLPCG